MPRTESLQSLQQLHRQQGAARGVRYQQLVAPARGAKLSRIEKTFEAGIPGCTATVRVLRGLDLNLEPGESLAVAGGPCSGKSTLLLILAGMLAPDRGRIIWTGAGGEPLREPALVEYLPAWNAGHAIKSLRRTVEARPGMLIVDDILAPLDSVSRREARVLLRELRSRRTTLVIATRYDSSVLSLCTRVAELRAGRISAG